MRRAAGLVLVVCAMGSVAPERGAAVLRAQTAAPAPDAAALTPERMEQFLTAARVVKSRPIGKGVTSPWRLTLSDGTMTRDAAFQSVDRARENVRFRNGRHERVFRDYYGYNIAAYRLARLIGHADIVPVSVERKWHGNPGALTWWVDKQWDEDERLKAGVEPPDRDAWERQVYRARVFTALVDDTDRNLGNQLVTADFHLWMIDFTRAFRHAAELDKADHLRKIDRALFDRLAGLSRDDLARAVKPYVDADGITALAARRAAIVRHFTRIAAERGAQAVFY